jgi:hypothetical protein
MVESLGQRLENTEEQGQARCREFAQHGAIALI